MTYGKNWVQLSVVSTGVGCNSSIQVVKWWISFVFFLAATQQSAKKMVVPLEPSSSPS